MPTGEVPRERVRPRKSYGILSPGLEFLGDGPSGAGPRAVSSKDPVGALQGGVTRLDSPLMYAQTTSPSLHSATLDGGGPWEAPWSLSPSPVESVAEEDATTERLTVLVSLLHRCEREDYETMLLLLALTIITDAITYSQANLRAFEHAPGWDGLLQALRAVAATSAPASWSSRVAALLYGVAVGHVPDGARQFGEMWRAVAEAPPGNDTAALRALMPGTAASAIVHARAAECTLRHADEAVAEGASGAHATLLALYALLEHATESSPRNTVVLGKSPIVSRLLQGALARTGGDAADARREAAWRDTLLRGLVADGLRSRDDVHRVLTHLVASPSVDANLAVLALLQDTSTSARRPGALEFVSSEFGAHEAGLRMDALDRPFPPDSPASSGYTVVVVLRLVGLGGGGAGSPLLDVLQLGDARLPRMRLSVDLSTRTLVFEPGGLARGGVALPRTQLRVGVWHHIVMTHTRSAPNVPSTLHVYMNGQRVCSPQVPWPGGMLTPSSVLFGSMPGGRDPTGTPPPDARGASVRWALASAVLHDGVLPPSIPMLLYELMLSQYTGNWQAPLAQFLSYESLARMQLRLDALGRAGGMRPDGRPGTTAFHALHQALYVGGARVFPPAHFYFHLQAGHTVRVPARGDAGAAHRDAAAHADDPWRNAAEPPRQHALLLLNRMVERPCDAARVPHGHARVVGVPTITVPRPLEDTVWAVGGSAVLLRLVQRADSREALRRSTALLLDLVSHSWRLADDAERLGVYGMLALLLRDQAEHISVGLLAGVLQAAGASGAAPLLANELLYRAVVLDVCLWARTGRDVQRAWLAHLPALLGPTAHGEANARRLSKVQLMKRLLYFARLARAHELCRDLIAAAAAILQRHFSARSAHALLLFLATHSDAWEPPDALLGVDYVRTDAMLDAAASMPRAEARRVDIARLARPAQDAGLSALAGGLLAMLAACLSADVSLLVRFAQVANAKHVLLLLRPSVCGTGVGAALDLVGVLLKDSDAAFGPRFRALGGYRVLERTLPPLWAEPGVFPWLWTLLFAAPPATKATLYSTFAPRRAWPARGVRLVQHAPLLRVIVLCVSVGLAAEIHAAVAGDAAAPHSRALCRRRRASMPEVRALGGLARTETRHALLRDSVRLLVRHSQHAEIAELLLLAPTMLCVFHAVSPALADLPRAPSAAPWLRLCDDLLDMLAQRIADAVAASSSLTLVSSIHASMPSSDPVLQSRLCARVYAHVLRHLVPALAAHPPRLTRRSTYELLADFLELASNESVQDLALQLQIFQLASFVFAQAQQNRVVLSPRAHALVVLATHRNLLHSTPRSSVAVSFADCWLPEIANASADPVFVACLLNRALAGIQADGDPSCVEIVLGLCRMQWPTMRAAGVTEELVSELSVVGGKTRIPSPLPCAQTWREMLAQQDTYKRSLLLERMRQIHTSAGQRSARAQGVFSTHARMHGWYLAARETDRLRFGRFSQDVREDAAYVRRRWRDAVDTLELSRVGAESDFGAAAEPPPLDALDEASPDAHLLPDAAFDEASPDAHLLPDAPLFLDADLLPDAHVPADTALRRVGPGGARDVAEACGAAATLTAAPPRPIPLPSSEEFEDKFRCVLRTLKHGDTIEGVFNTSRVTGVDVRGTLVVVAQEHLYLLDDYFQRPSGEIIGVWDARPEERDALIVAALALPHMHTPRGGDAENEAQVRFWAWRAIERCFRRAWLHRRTALELFCADGQSSMLVLPNTADADRLYSALRGKAPHAVQASEALVEGVRDGVALPTPLATSRLTGAVLRRTHAVARVTQAWQERRLSNAQYLMTLNTLAGRTMNDLTQFPIFPWVLADYTSARLDLADAASFRRLDRPMGAQTAARRAEFADRYAQLVEVNMEPFHYGTHYSTAASVCSFLVRLQPFAQLMRELHGGHFDLADRTFSSLERTWRSASEVSRADVRELIPEFFFLPEMFINTNQFDFGRTQAGAAIDDVELPPWAHGDPWLFVQLHREALESEHVSAHLHEWIDLVFGHRSHGPAAVAATNLFHPLSYASHVDLEQIDSPLERQAAAQVVHNFGQTPSPLFLRAHPARARRVDTPPWDARASFFAFPHLVVASRAPVAVVDGAVSAIAPLGDASVRADTGGRIRVRDSPYVLSYGYVDDSLRVDAERPAGRGTAAPVVLEQVALGRITAVCSVDEYAVVVGSEDGVAQLLALRIAQARLETRAVWRGHRAAILCATVSSAWSIAVTGSADHTAIVWDLNRERYVRALRGHDHGVHVVAVDDKAGWIATVAGSEVFVWSVNGVLLARQTTRMAARGAVTSLVFVEQDFHVGRLALLLTGHHGAVVLWQVVSNHAATKDGAEARGACGAARPRWRLEKMHVFDAPDRTAGSRGARITALHVLAPGLFASGNEAGQVYAWALPGAALPVPDAAHACSNVAQCGRRFGFLEPKKMCTACGGAFCGATMVRPEEVARYDWR
ncbi:beige protein-like 1 [Malassezia sp. CBS 17886]|nr:beige protein-like 1 [Malassezia sp. CBS 17886]